MNKFPLIIAGTILTILGIILGGAIFYSETQKTNFGDPKSVATAAFTAIENDNIDKFVQSFPPNQKEKAKQIWVTFWSKNTTKVKEGSVAFSELNLEPQNGSQNPQTVKVTGKSSYDSSKTQIKDYSFSYSLKLSKTGDKWYLEFSPSIFSAWFK